MGSPYGGIQLAEGSYTALNVNGASTLLSSNPCTLCRVTVVISGTGTGSVWDANSVASVAATNKIMAIGASTPIGTIFEMMWPCFNGLVVNAGTGNTVAVSFA